MKNKTTAILVTAALLLASAGIGKAAAYFTTYAEVKGSMPIHLGDTTTITEETDGTEKEVTITNSLNSNKAVWVRAKAITGEKYKEGLVYSETENWTEDGEWHIYNEPLEPGETAQMHVSITDWPKEDVGKDFNVVIVYETTPAVEDGEKDGELSYLAADWKGSASNGAEEGGAEG